jgi:hypothetical protein
MAGSQPCTGLEDDPVATGHEFGDVVGHEGNAFLVVG